MKVEEGLIEHQNEFWNHVESFIEHYEIAREEAQSVLGELFQETDYPGEIKSKFRFHWRYVILDTPKKSSILPPEIYEHGKGQVQIFDGRGPGYGHVGASRGIRRIDQSHDRPISGG